MRKIMKTIAIVIGVILLALIITAFIFWLRRDQYILDGPGMVYEPIGPILREDKWVEVGSKDDSYLMFDGSKMTAKVYGEENKYTYSTAFEYTPDGLFKAAIIMEDGVMFPGGDLVFHQEKVGDNVIDVISCTIFEMDGRGEIVISEYVKEKELRNLPENYRSQMYESYNNTPAIPTYIEAEPVGLEE